MKLINLTPHAIVLYAETSAEPDGKGSYIVKPDAEPLYTLPASGTVARALVTKKRLNDIDFEGISAPVFSMEYGDVEGLPAPEKGTCYVVSALTAQAAQRNGRGTNDLLLVANSVRNEQGQIIGCTAFSQV